MYMYILQVGTVDIPISISIIGRYIKYINQPIFHSNIGSLKLYYNISILC